MPCIYRERAGISLYDALHDSNPGSKAFYFSSEIISTVSATLARFRGICDSFQVPLSQISVFATEAMRTSENRDEMLGAIKKASGLDVQLLSPAMESLFGAMGARTGFDHVDGLFMDLGGGSVQMTYVNSRTDEYDVLAAKAASSMPYGAAKVSAAINSTGAQLMRDDLQSLMKKTFDGLKEQFPQLKADAESSEGVTIYFCGGGFRGYGSMLMHTHDIQPYPIPAIGGFVVSGSKFVQWEDMLAVNESYSGKIYGLSKRRRSQFHAIVTVVESLVKAVPNIKRVVFCSGGNREGVLYMKLPKEIRESLPMPLLPGGSKNFANACVDDALRILSQALPANRPEIFSAELQHYVVQNTWIDMGDPDNANSAKALHNPISGFIAGLPGLTHEIRAILALTMCARWGTDIGPTDQALYKNLQQLVGPNLSFWCAYVGTLVRLLATIAPGYAVSDKPFGDLISFVQSELPASGTSDVQSSVKNAAKVTGLGKKGKHGGIQLRVIFRSDAMNGVDPESLTGLFKNVGEGSDQRVEVKFT